MSVRDFLDDYVLPAVRDFEKGPDYGVQIGPTGSPVSIAFAQP